MAREWVINSYEGYAGLVLQACEPTSAGPGEVRLKIEAFALNWGDMDLMLDRYSFSFPKFPARIGMEATGIVDQVGPGVEGIEVGQRYCTLPYFYDNAGTSADYAVVDARYVTPAPEGLSAVEATSVWMQYMTAYYPVIDISKADAKTNILATAGTSTAGTAALQLGRMAGATMITTTRFAANEAYLRANGADHVIVSDDRTDIAAAISEATGGVGAHVVFDPVGQGMIARYSPALAKGATIFFYGTLDGVFPQLPIVDMFQTNATFHPYSLFNYVENPEALQRGLNFVYAALKSGQIAPQIDRVYPMEQYREAWDYLSQPRNRHGKVVIETGAASS